MPPTLRAILALRFGLGDAYCSCGAAGGRTPFGDAVSSMLRDGVPKLRKQPPSVSKPLSFANMAQLLSKVGSVCLCLHSAQAIYPPAQP